MIDTTVATTLIDRGAKSPEMPEFRVIGRVVLAPVDIRSLDPKMVVDRTTAYINLNRLPENVRAGLRERREIVIARADRPLSQDRLVAYAEANGLGLPNEGDALRFEFQVPGRARIYPTVFLFGPNRFLIALCLGNGLGICRGREFSEEQWGSGFAFALAKKRETNPFFKKA